MPHYALVVVDVEKAHRARLHQVARFKLRPHEHALPEAERLQRIKARVGTSLDVGAGHLWSSADRECPDGLPNCEHCGDPDFGAACQAAGHCPRCGVLHGIAPRSRLDAIGVSLVEVPEHHVDPVHRRPHPHLEWDPVQRGFRVPQP